MAKLVHGIGMDGLAFMDVHKPDGKDTSLGERDGLTGRKSESLFEA